MTAARAVVLASGLAVARAPQAAAWGDKGHEMSARVAVHTLPADLPAFFRAADVELAYLIVEPDRWRSPTREPALFGAADRDHSVKLEDITEALPPHRYDFFLQYAGKPRPGGGTYGWRDMGFALYAIAEQAERLTYAFMQWRNAGAATAADQRRKRQIEADALVAAGILGHIVTDLAMPLHTTVASNGWVPRLPNPHGFVGENIHQRFETFYVNAAIEERDFQPLVGPVRERGGGWLEAALDHARASHNHVEEVYAFDQAHPWSAKGGQTPEAKRFTCERLAFGAQALRDLWYTAWVRSKALAAAAEVNPNRARYRDDERASSGSRRTSR